MAPALSPCIAIIRATWSCARSLLGTGNRGGLRIRALRLLEVAHLLVDDAQVFIRHAREEIVFGVGHVGDQSIARLVQLAILEIRAAEVEARELANLARWVRPARASRSRPRPACSFSC